MLELVLAALLADGHVLIEDVPGVAKTLMARSFAAVTGARFARVQFTPDLLPGDLTGSSIYDQRRGDLVFRPGPVFTNILLADEVNRAPPKTQAALLEAMEEHQVTADDGTRVLDRPFLVIATQNPVDFEGTYPLPEAQLDRFIMRVAVGYPDEAGERELLMRRAARASPEVKLTPCADQDLLRAMQATVATAHVEPDVASYIAAIVRGTRELAGVEIGVSPRGGIALMQLARAVAVLDGRSYVLPDDVKRVAVPALAHRLILRPELWVQRVAPEDLIRVAVEQVPAPVTRPAAGR